MNESVRKLTSHNEIHQNNTHPYIRNSATTEGKFVLDV